MSALYTFPKQVAFNNGAILPGAKLYFYQTGTTTPQNTYTDNARTVAHSNPVVADADGLFDPIYLDPTLPDYRVKFTTPSDVQIWQVDNVPSNQNTQQSLRLQSTNPYLFLYDTDGTAGQRKYRLRVNGATFYIEQSNDNEDTFTTLFSAASGIATLPTTALVGSDLVASRVQTSFTGTLTGMTGTTTGTFSAHKVGSLACITTSSAVTGTSNSTSMTLTGVPSGFQASFARTCKCIVTDAGNTSMDGMASIFGGTVTFSIAKTNAVANFNQYSSTAFTNSGTKGVGAGWSIFYYLD